MNTKQAAVQWGVTQSTVQKYCKLGFVRGVKPGVVPYQIPDAAKCPYVVRRATRSQQKDCDHILRAVNGGYDLHAKAIKLEAGALQAYLDMLCEEKFLRRVKSKIAGPDTYLLAAQGRAYLLADKQHQIDILLKALQMLPTG